MAFLEKNIILVPGSFPNKPTIIVKNFAAQPAAAEGEGEGRSFHGDQPTASLCKKPPESEPALQEGWLAAGGHPGQKARLLLHPEEEGDILGLGRARLPWHPPEGHGGVRLRVLGAHAHQGGCGLHVGSRPDSLRRCCLDGPRTSGDRQANGHCDGDPRKQVQRSNLPRLVARLLHDRRHVSSSHRLC